MTMKKTLVILCGAMIVFNYSLVAQRLKPFQNNKGKWGYKDSSGEIKIKAKYSAVNDFMQGLAVVNRKQKQGVINTKGRYVLKPKYQRILPVNKHNIQTGFIVTKVKKHALYGANGKALTGFVYDLIKPQTYTSQRILAKKQGKHGYLDLQGKEVIPFVYDWASNFYDKSAQVVRQGAILQIDEAGKEAIPLMTVEVQAMPKGGLKKFHQYIEKNLRYPSEAKERGIKGKVNLQFTVEKDGSLTNIKVLKGLGYGCDEEAIRLMKAAPKWYPSKIQGIPRRVTRTLPITFKLKK
jgi:TonB family protein